MNIETQILKNAYAIKFTVQENGQEVGRAYLYVLQNDLHKQPFGFIEDVYVKEAYRSQGMGSSLVRQLIEEAKNQGCYKLICTSRLTSTAHKFYERLGFKDHGKEFRMDLG